MDMSIPVWLDERRAFQQTRPHIQQSRQALHLAQFKRQKRNISGWLILNKPFDVSSTEAVGKLRWLFSAKKAGHAGTLDPLATGILPIAFGEATKTVPFVQDGLKTYRFSIVWGTATSTEDAEGEVIGTSEVRPSEADVLAQLPRFTGTISQVPPAYSAIKIDGARAYDRARAGEQLEMPPREVTIDRFDLIEQGAAQSTFEIDCEKGTYVRALARDLAEALGTRGHVGKLHRAAVGPFTDEDAIDIADVEALAAEARDDLLMPVSAGLTGLAEITLDERQTSAVRHGNPALLTGAGAPIALDECWASHRGQAVAIGFVEKGQFNPTRVILPGT